MKKALTSIVTIAGLLLVLWLLCQAGQPRVEFEVYRSIYS